MTNVALGVYISNGANNTYTNNYIHDLIMKVNTEGTPGSPEDDDA